MFGGVGVWGTTVCKIEGSPCTITPRTNQFRDWVQAAHGRKATSLIELVLNTVET